MQKDEINKLFSIWIIGEKRSMNNPNQEVNGPGITGRKLPKSPIKIKNPESEMIVKSIG